MANQVRTAERRRGTRHPAKGKVRVLWEHSDGQHQVCIAELVEVSHKGLRIRVEVNMPPRTYVTINERELGIVGRGSVRYCRFEKGKYAVGLEFSNGTGWKTPADSASIHNPVSGS